LKANYLKLYSVVFIEYTIAYGLKRNENNVAKFNIISNGKTLIEELITCYPQQ